ncbi:MAG: hypothetical protein AB200_01180 [Parcubacteria bacterium C7867-005]|nr:MAG: hypothetical protein AB200_01180 [Parcubacteria bacterium C7867-005]
MTDQIRKLFLFLIIPIIFLFIGFYARDLNLLSEKAGSTKEAGVVKLEVTTKETAPTAKTGTDSTTVPPTPAKTTKKATAPVVSTPAVPTPVVFTPVTSGTGASKVVFLSDWSNSTGTGQSAVGDGGKWSILGNVNEVIENEGLGLPIRVENVLRIPGATGGTNRKSGMPPMTVGVARNYRLYFRNDMPFPTSDTQTHPFQDGNAGSQINWAVIFHNTVSANQIKIGFTPYTQSSGCTTYWYGPNLNKGTWYLLDWQIIYRTTTTLNAYIRVSDASGNVLYDSDDFVPEAYCGSSSLATFNSNNTFTANPGGGISRSDGLNIGTNDNMPEFAPTYGHQAAVAVVDGLPQGTFIGPYGSVAGEN